jgi:hypothetical protein
MKRFPLIAWSAQLLLSKFLSLDLVQILPGTPGMDCPMFCTSAIVSVAQLFKALIGPVFLYQA